MKKAIKLFPFVIGAFLILAQGLAFANATEKQPMDEESIQDLLAQLDKKSKFNGDYKAIIYAHSKNRETGEKVQQIAVYRRDEDDRMMMLFLKPKSDAGKGYLLIDKNFFSFEPSTGSWTRVSDERVGGSALNKGNFNGFNFTGRYKGTFVAHEKLGKYPVVHIRLDAKEQSTNEEQRIELWVETVSNNVLKQQDYALSGRLLRTTYRTDYKKFQDEAGVAQFVPMKSIVYDEVEKGNQTTMVIEQIEIKELVSNLFTKAWLESKSR